MGVKLNCAESTIKYILFFFNILFLIGGLAVLVLGAIIITEVGRYDSFFEDPFAAPGIILVTCGALIVVTGFFGCCGAIRQSFWMLLTFSCCMTVIFLLQLVGGILAFTFQDEMDVILENNLRYQMELYDDPEVGDQPKNTWDTLQKNFQCCGIDTYSDWYTVAGIQTPDSCNCDANNANICNPLGSFKDGCLEKLRGYFTQMQTALGAVGICFAIAELAGVAFALIVAFSIKGKVKSVSVKRVSSLPDTY